MAERYTESQKKAVETIDGNVLVSASAGSGKTFVMIERLIKIIIEGKAKVSEILAVTFTEAAAAEMKQKLVNALRKQLAVAKDKAKIREALDETQTASISTVHKFCADLLRAYFYEIGLDPTFKIADKTVSDDLRARAADKVFEENYEAGDEDFLYLVRVFRSGRSDGELKKILGRLDELACSEKDPDFLVGLWGEEPTEEEFKRVENALIEGFIERANVLLGQSDELETYLSSSPIKNVEKYFEVVRATLDSGINAKTVRELSVACSAKLPTAPSVKKELEEEKKALDGFKDKLKKLLADFATLSDDEEESKKDFLTTGRTVKTISKLLLSYRKEYAELKNEEACVDFSDLEHLAYKLLTTSPDVLQSVRNKYKYAFCDEYQDVNGVQEAILSLVAPDRLFMVGDVKQCIYAFRGCNPEIFAGKFAEYDEKGGNTVVLAENFRSTEGVLSAVNNVFSSAMTKKNSGVDYAAEPMKFGGLYPKDTGKTVMDVIVGEKEEKEGLSGVYDLVKDATDTEENDSFYEGILVGKIIEEELGSEIFDLKLGKYRQAEPSDIAVLLRDSRTFSGEVVKTLTRLNIPVTSSAKNSIVDYPEIKLLVDVLSLIDFYADDAPLVAVLKSSIGGLDEEELAEIREFGKKNKSDEDGKRNSSASFEECVRHYVESGDDPIIKKKLADFDEYFKKIRLLSEFTGAGDLLNKIIKDKGLDLEIASEGLGRLKLDRVERFVQESESGGEKLSVKDFLKRIIDLGDDFSLISADGGNSVKVMSMHASKGLEFPIVIVAGLGRKFNAIDERETLLTSRKYGLAPYAYDEENMLKKPTIKRALLKLEKRKDTAREELRLLYVAMTRAQSRLHLVSSAALPAARTGETVLAARKFADFFSENDMETRYIDRSELEYEAKKEQVGSVLAGEYSKSLKRMISDNLRYVYPYSADCLLPLKRTVTEIAENAYSGNIGNAERLKGISEGDTFYDSEDLYYADDDYVFTDFRLRGIAYHRFLELWNFEEKNADNELIRQLISGELTEKQAELLDKNTLKKIVSLPIFGEMKEWKTYREQPFEAFFNADEIGYDGTKTEVLVQGVIDLLAIKDGEAIIIDYKVSKRDAETLLKKYGTQLSLYKRAVERSLKLKVKKCMLLNVFTGELIETR